MPPTSSARVRFAPGFALMRHPHSCCTLVLEQRGAEMPIQDGAVGPSAQARASVLPRCARDEQRRHLEPTPIHPKYIQLYEGRKRHTYRAAGAMHTYFDGPCVCRQAGALQAHMPACSVPAWVKDGGLALLPCARMHACARGRLSMCGLALSVYPLGARACRSAGESKIRICPLGGLALLCHFAAAAAPALVLAAVARLWVPNAQVKTNVCTIMYRTLV